MVIKGKIKAPIKDHVQEVKGCRKPDDENHLADDEHCTRSNQRKYCKLPERIFEPAIGPNLMFKHLV